MTYEELLAENKALKSELASIKKLIFGQKSERFQSNESPANQASLFAEEASLVPADTVTEKITYDRKKRKAHPGRQSLPEHLPVEEHVIEPEEDTTGLKCIGKEITERLDYHPAKLIRVRYIRNRYVKKENGEERIIIGELPQGPIEKGLAQSGLLAHLFVSKFIDHLPFYRQLRMIKREHNFELPASTVNDWFKSCCDLLQPLYKELERQVINSHYLQVDESPIKVLESEKQRQSHQGYMWVYHQVVEGLVLFKYRKGRGRHGPMETLKDFKGYLQCDGYKVYDRVGQKYNLTLIGCLAHVRRKFHDALQNDKSRAEHALEIIQSIYRIDKQYRQEKLTAQQWRQGINEKLESLKQWVDNEANKLLPKSTIGKACSYFVKQWPKLQNITISDDTRIDNNLIENKIRPLALGRKNYLFAGNHKAGERIAMMYSFFATCKIHNVNPWEWLKDVLDRIPQHSIQNLNTLLPSLWEKS